MNLPIINDTRTFERFPGTWKIIDITKDKNITFTLLLNNLKCIHCGKEVFSPKNYTFNYIEKLENNNEIKYLGISNDNRYIILNDYLSMIEIENKIKETL